jgi:hypothetical protein
MSERTTTPRSPPRDRRGRYLRSARRATVRRDVVLLFEAIIAEGKGDQADLAEAESEVAAAGGIGRRRLRGEARRRCRRGARAQLAEHVVGRGRARHSRRRSAPRQLPLALGAGRAVGECVRAPGQKRTKSGCPFCPDVCS